MEIRIKRNPDQTKETTGVMTVGEFICVTLELPFLNNLVGKSCIIADIYEWVKVAPTEHIPYIHISILNVKGRSGVCIHIFNFATGKNIQTLGCIGVGESFVDLDGNGIVDLTNSKNTFEKLMALLPDSGTLVIE